MKLFLRLKLFHQHAGVENGFPGERKSLNFSTAYCQQWALIIAFHIPLLVAPPDEWIFPDKRVCARACREVNECDLWKVLLFVVGNSTLFRFPGQGKIAERSDSVSTFCMVLVERAVGTLSVHVFFSSVKRDGLER